jgi:hypothetical protein
MPGVLQVHYERVLGRGPGEGLHHHRLPTQAAQILQLKEAGATDDDLQRLLAGAITYSYFQEGGTTRKGLRADFTDVDGLDISF